MAENIINKPPEVIKEQPNLSEKNQNIKPSDDFVQLAKDVLRGVHSEPKDLEGLYKKLKKHSKFSLARKILYILKKKNTDASKSLKLYQQEALCTYKDPDMPSDVKFDKALDILKHVEDFKTTTNTETLGLLGAIYKRKWQFDSRISSLKKSKHYYLRGHKIWLNQIENNLKDTDSGYTGINAAYVSDLMASIQINEIQDLGDSEELREYLNRIKFAKNIRSEIYGILSEKIKNQEKNYLNYWVYTTLVEACMGLGQFDESLKYWKQAIAIESDSWELDSTQSQLISLGQILLKVKKQEIFLECMEESAAVQNEKFESFSKELHNFLEAVLQKGAQITEMRLAGKIGLGLSGGGFRASFYHIGVLAKMAEFDLLRHVEVISCVSGGSIIGAYYYLKLLYLLEQKKDQDITKEDYIQIVRDIENDFLAAVRNDVRGTIFVNLRANLRMFFGKKYSRSHRLAELYERHFYKKLFDDIVAQRKERGIESNWDGPIRMQDLLIYPAGTKKGEFSPKQHNWKRNNKIPNLILNATALNTGHNWQFTASWMGEPPGNIVKEVDAKCRLRRMYYWEAPGEHKNMGLSQAVAASSGVPGVFPPLTLENLYPGQNVQLVDGGVHDNQGIVGLTEQECQVLFVSDSSGQLLADETLSNNPVSILPRTNSVLMERVRECQYLDLKSRTKSSLIKGMMFVHLRKGLFDKPLDWIHCEDPHEASDTASAFYEKGVLTKYNIRKDVQELLASVRTDLDAFNDAEAFALMYSGYQMTEHEHLQSTANCLPEKYKEMKKEEWNFEAVKEMVSSSEKSVWLKNILKVGGSLLFKSFYLSNRLTAFAVIFGVLVIGGISLLFYFTWDNPLFDLSLSVSHIGKTIMWIAISLIVGKTVMSIIQYKDTLKNAIRDLLVAITGSATTFLINPILNRVYLNKGNKDAIEEKKKE